MLQELDREVAVRGRHHSDWVATLDRLRALGTDDAGLELLLECMAAAEREAWSVQGVPASMYAHRAAVIHRRRRDYAAEVEVLERWIAACPEPRDPHSRLAVRLVKARRLRDAAGVQGKIRRFGPGSGRPGVVADADVAVISPVR